MVIVGNHNCPLRSHLSHNHALEGLYASPLYPASSPDAPALVRQLMAADATRLAPMRVEMSRGAASTAEKREYLG